VIERGPDPDYEPTKKEIRDVQRVLEAAAFSYKSHNGRKDWVDKIATALIIIGIPVLFGLLFSMSVRLALVEDHVARYMQDHPFKASP
jgi:hypothetical protein